MCLSWLPGSACSQSSPQENPASGPNPGNPTFTPFGKYADVGTHEIMNTHPGVRFHGWFASLLVFYRKLINRTQVGSASTLHLNKGSLLGKDIAYISQV